jgi:hypothetical protein
MSNPADLLWRVNSEYQKRLTQVVTYLNLLEQIVLMQDGDNQMRTLAALQYALEQVEVLAQEHRTWRYKYYYESADSKRMVQAPGAIHHALARFSRMRMRHEQELNNLHSLLDHVQRPDPRVTRVPTGDLWVMTEFAINDLRGFDRYMQNLTGV